MTTETTTIQIGGADLVRASVILALFGGLLAAALSQLDKLGFVGAGAVVVAALLALVFFAIFQRSPLLPTAVAMGLCLGPALVDNLNGTNLEGLIMILMGLAATGLLFYAGRWNSDLFNGKTGWWAPVGVLTCFLVLFGILVQSGMIGRMPTALEASAYGLLGGLCLLAGMANNVAFERGRDWADNNAAYLAYALAAAAFVVTVLVVVLDPATK